MVNNLNKLEKTLDKNKNPKKAKLLQGFFKTGKGQYGEGDIFLGIIVPESRKIAKEFASISLKEIKYLLESKIHEKRLIALFILMDKYKIADKNKDFKIKEEIFKFYINNSKNINNWDLVDLSAPNISGHFLIDKKRDILYSFAGSENLWEKRISIISTFYFIKNNQFEDSFKIAKILLDDSHDLIHKAIGWMLREIGKRNQKIEEEFLKKNYKKIPRTTLRYAIERFDEEKRIKYLNGKF